MQYVIKSTGDAITGDPEIPAHLLQHQIPGFAATVLRFAGGVLLMQQVSLHGYGLQYFVCDPVESLSFFESFSEPVAFCYLVIQGETENKSKETGYLHFKESQFNIVYTPVFSNNFHISGTKETVFIRILFPEKILSHHLSFFPVFEALKNQIVKHKTGILSEAGFFADASMFDYIFRLIHAPYSENISAFHMNIITDFLTAALKTAAKEGVSKKNFSLNYIERIHEAKVLIDTNLPDHLTIGQIANRIKMNEQKLKKGFKDIFGTGLYGYLREQVLKIAKIQLEETDKPIKEIAMIANYRSQGNFSAAFKRHFNMTPLECRLNSQKQATKDGS